MLSTWTWRTKSDAVSLGVRTQPAPSRARLKLSLEDRLFAIRFSLFAKQGRPAAPLVVTGTDWRTRERTFLATVFLAKSDERRAEFSDQKGKRNQK